MATHQLPLFQLACVRFPGAFQSTFLDTKSLTATSILQSEDDPMIMRMKKLEDILIANRRLEGGNIITDKWLAAVRHAGEDARNRMLGVPAVRAITDPLSDEEEYSDDEDGVSTRAYWWSPVKGHAIYSYKGKVCRHTNPDTKSLLDGDEGFENSCCRSREY